MNISAVNTKRIIINTTNKEIFIYRLLSISNNTKYKENITKKVRICFKGLLKKAILIKTFLNSKKFNKY